MKIEPVGQRIIVKKLSGAEARGIILPPGVKDHTLVGEVLAKGPEADWVEVGDVVHYARFSGTKVVTDHVYVGDEYDDCLYMNCEDILSRLRKEAEEVK